MGLCKTSNFSTSTYSHTNNFFPVMQLVQLILFEKLVISCPSGITLVELSITYIYTNLHNLYTSLSKEKY